MKSNHDLSKDGAHLSSFESFPGSQWGRLPACGPYCGPPHFHPATHPDSHQPYCPAPASCLLSDLFGNLSWTESASEIEIEISLLNPPPDWPVVFGCSTTSLIISQISGTSLDHYFQLGTANIVNCNINIKIAHLQVCEQFEAHDGLAPDGQDGPPVWASDHQWHGRLEPWAGITWDHSLFWGDFKCQALIAGTKISLQFLLWAGDELGQKFNIWKMEV